MPTCADAALLTPDEHLREVAYILAAGVLRLRQRGALPTDDVQKKPSELSAAGLCAMSPTYSTTWFLSVVNAKCIGVLLQGKLRPRRR